MLKNDTNTGWYLLLWPGQTSDTKTQLIVKGGFFVSSDQYQWSSVDISTRGQTNSLFSTDTWSEKICINNRGERGRNQTPPVLTRMKVWIFLALTALALGGIPRPEEARDEAPQTEESSALPTPEVSLVPDSHLDTTEHWMSLWFPDVNLRPDLLFWDI